MRGHCEKGECHRSCLERGRSPILWASFSLSPQLSIKAFWWGENNQSFMNSLSWLKYKAWKNNFDLTEYTTKKQKKTLTLTQQILVFSWVSPRFLNINRLMSPQTRAGICLVHSLFSSSWNPRVPNSLEPLEGAQRGRWSSAGGALGDQAGTQTRCEQKSQKGAREGPAQSLCCLICAKKHQCAISGAGLDPLGAFQLNIFYDSMKYFSICNHWQLLDTNLRVSGVNGKKWFLWPPKNHYFFFFV